jgi:hypothetical protein
MTGSYAYRLSANFGTGREYSSYLRNIRRPAAILVGDADEQVVADQFAPLLQRLGLTIPGHHRAKHEACRHDQQTGSMSGDPFHHLREVGTLVANSCPVFRHSDRLSDFGISCHLVRMTVGPASPN